MPHPLMVFAAGFGTRMQPLTLDRPKPLIPVAGRALLDHALDLAGAPGARRIVVNAHYKAEMITEHLRARPDITVSHENPILDTAGGLRHALPLLGDGPVLTLNSDAVWAGPSPLPALEAAFDPPRMDALLMVIPVAQALAHEGPGDFTVDPEGRLQRGPGTVYSGTKIMHPRLLDGLDDGPVSLNACWTRAEAAGRLFGLIYPGEWVDVGHPGAIEIAEALYAEARDGAV